MSNLSPQQTPPPPSLEDADLTRHKLTVKEFASSRRAQVKLVEEWKEEIEGIVKRICPLDFFPQEFVIVDWKQLQVILARDGFPKRYEHWRFGQQYESQKVRDTYGFGKVYELVINNDPCIAYLLDSNSVQETRTVMAHVYFHNIFFKHNAFFKHTDRSMLNKMGNHAERIKRHQEEQGPEKVEAFLDVCLSIDNLIDPHSVAIRRAREDVVPVSKLEIKEREPVSPTRFDVPKYLERYVNPPEALKAEVDRELAARERRTRVIPSEPEQDILLFLLKYAPLEPWQQDILSIVREEAYYFAPQMMTKIMNEGWASYWHSKCMTEHLLPRYPSETVDYCDFNAAVLAPGGFNPYRLGVRLLRDIEDRWDKGKFGPEWENCRDMQQRRLWDKKLGLGMQEIMQAMQSHNDLTFIDRYLTPEFCSENKLFAFKREKDDSIHVTSEEFENVRATLIGMLTNRGQPHLSVIHSNHGNRGELVVFHSYDGKELDLKLAEPTARNIFALWTRPVHVVTRGSDGERLVLSFNGSKFSSSVPDSSFEGYYEGRD